MLQKIKNKLKNIQTNLKEFNKVYIDYILCITFLNLIFLKINKLLFQIPSIYIYLIIILISIIFINQWSFITNQIKNTYIFNWILYNFLIFKDSLYQIIFEYFEFVEELKYQKIMVFLTGFILSSWGLNFFFLILNHSYNISILFFFILLIINILNLIEKKLIFTSENISEKKGDLDYNFIKGLLKINNLKFNKNKSLFYIEKRYVHLNEIKNLIKKHGVTIITSATAGSLFTGYLQHSSVQVQKESLEVQIKQFEFQKEMEIQKIHSDKLKMREERLSNYDDKIGALNKKINKLQIDMDSRNFWNKVDFSGTIADLKSEREVLKRRRFFFEEEMKLNESFQISPEKKIKIKIDNNSIFDD